MRRLGRWPSQRQQLEDWRKRETSLAAHAAERITFGVDSGAALTVIGKDVAAEHPRVQGTHEADDRLPREPCGELGAERPCLEGANKEKLRKGDRGVSSHQPAVGEHLVDDRA